jgi:hypothetical protein
MYVSEHKYNILNRVSSSMKFLLFDTTKIHMKFTISCYLICQLFNCEGYMASNWLEYDDEYGEIRGF